MMGRWDRSWLEKAFEHLLSNAAKYGHGHPIEVRLEGEHKVVRLAVRNHGPTIPLDDQRRIFGRFERTASTRHYGGFGLGLWSVRKIVEAHGGLVRVESRPGEGATFTIELPRSENPRSGP
jgi:two-component system, OmpR family, sensor kinase